MPGALDGWTMVGPWSVAGALLVTSLSAFADDRLAVPPGQTSALAVASVAQGDDGWVWYGGVEGLYRYDGAQSVRWGGDFQGEPIEILRLQGELATVLGQDRRLYAVSRHTWRELPGPLGGRTRHAAWSDRRIWAVGEGILYLAGGDGSWSAVPAPFPVRLVRAASRGVWALGEGEIARINEDGVVLQRLPIPRAMDVEETAGGGYAATRERGVWRWDSDGVRLIEDFRDDAWGEGVEAGPGGVWVLTTRDLLRFVGDELVARVPIPGGAPQHPALEIDWEGSVWVGSARGLRLRTSPDAIALRHGAPDPWFTWLQPHGEAVWAASWRAAGRFGAQGWEGAGYTGFSWPFCEVDGALVTLAWDPGHPVLVHLTDRVEVVHEPAPPGEWVGCAHTAAGLLAITTGGAFLPQDTGWDRVEAASGSPWAFARDRRGRLFLIGDDASCEADHRDPTSWTCTPWVLPRPGGIVEVGPDRLWAFGNAAGVLERIDGRWRSHPSSRTLRSLSVRSVVPTGEDQAWILALGEVIRVRLGPPGAPWTVLERVGPAQGAPPSGANHLLERPDGSLWLATDVGVVVIPAEARRPMQLPMAPTLIAVHVDGRPVDPGSTVVAPWPDHQIEVRGAAPTYRDRSHMVWRASVGRGPPVDSADPTVRLVDLPAGDTAVSLQVSVDGGASWSPPSLPLRVRVVLPWYLRPPAWISAIVLGIIALVLAWRARVQALLRVERERTRIAMDLHDDLGAGLSTVTMLTGLAADPELPDEARRDVAREAASAASTLADSLAGIVWTLRRDAGTGEALARALTERARRLFSGGETRLVVDLATEWPPTHLSLAKYRNLQLIGYEALANVARHADAREVILRFYPWTLEILDDGRGLLAPSPRTGTGTGLGSMEARARAIGATLSVSARPGGGTAVQVRFRP